MTKRADLVYGPAWPGGPLRIVGTGNGKPSRYVCSECLSPSRGVYFVKRAFTQAEMWLCASCRMAHTPKREQPAGLKAYRRAQEATA